MIFSSLTFIFVFLPFVCSGYFLLKFCFPKKLSIRNIFLCISSLFFYAWGEPVYIILMLLSIIANYFFAMNRKKVIFILAIIFNLLFLFVFKYSGFFVANINYICKTHFNVPSLALPIGISFYTFQILSYVIDVYRGNVKTQKNIVSLALYISLFPQLIAGPIVRYVDIEKELDNRVENFDKFVDGLKDFFIGLGAKVIIANNLAVAVDGIYGNYSEACSGILWLAAVAYSFQIYFDFSGYSRMAIGIGKMFGFTFPENFNYPYCASSITDFWRRWHITLSVWFRDYVYIPLGGNRCSVVKHIFNIIITWLLTGFWHGASWNFILWGVYYGLLLIIEKYFIMPLLKKNDEKKVLHCLFKILQRFIVLILLILGWVIFRLENFSQLITVLKQMFVFGELFNKQSVVNYIAQHADVCSKLIFIIPAIITSIPIYEKIFGKSEKSKVVYSLELLYAFVIFAICICLLIADTYNPFIYFRF